MESFASYLLQSTIWLTGFTLVYILFLKNERFFVLNRLFLISGIMVSLFFPLIRVRYNVELPAATINPIDIAPGVTSNVTDKPVNYWPVLFCLYFAGVFVFAARLIWQTFRLYKSIKKANFNKWGPARLIRASEYSAPFSFFIYVFINPSTDDYETEEIMHHEIVHITQKHWFDLLLVEMLCLFQWVNPFAWIYTRFIRLNHEYLADETALQRTSDPAIYRATLLNQMFNAQVLSLSNSFNYSLNKKRFDMMKKIITSPYRKMKILPILPVFAIVLYSFAKPEYSYVQTDNNTSISKLNGTSIIAETTLNEINSFVPQKSSYSPQPASHVLVVAQPAKNEVKGKVVENNGKPLHGANILVTGTSTGASTDSKGYFKLDNVPDEAMLVATYVGFNAIAIKPDLSSEMIITMIRDTVYNMGGFSIRNVDGNESLPLYILDGVITNDLNNIDPNVIESVAVTKGDSAVVKYGEKAKNGVVEITTKKNVSKGTGKKMSDVVVTGYGNGQKTE
jgi:hypothetical protein